MSTPEVSEIRRGWDVASSTAKEERRYEGEREKGTSDAGSPNKLICQTRTVFPGCRPKYRHQSEPISLQSGATLPITVPQYLSDELGTVRFCLYMPQRKTKCLSYVHEKPHIMQRDPNIYLSDGD